MATKKTKPAEEPVEPTPEAPVPEPDTAPAEAAPAEPEVPQMITVVAAAPAAEEVPTMDEKLMAVLAPLGLSQQTMEILVAQRLTTLSAFEGITKADLTGQGVKLGDANQIANAVFAATAPATPVAPTAASTTTASFDLLPAVPEDTSFLEMLKVGGQLKIDTTSVIAAMRAAFAANVGLYSLPEVIMERMEAFAEAQEEPVGDSFFRLQKLVTQRGYGEVLSFMGVPGNFVSERRKKAVLQRLDTILWPALRKFNGQLVGWSEAWGAGMANPAMALTVLAMAQSGTTGVMPPGMMQPPDTSGLRDEAEAVINNINKVFAGVGIPVAKALAYDSVRIRELLDDPALPAALGAGNKDQMLKTLGVTVGADLVRAERNVTRYALAVMEFPKVTAGTSELAYLSALLQLGMQIPWDQLGGPVAKETRRTSGGGFPGGGTRI